jgi:uncharacterized protein YfaS (alpha-2-macroglobulin family)
MRLRIALLLPLIALGTGLVALYPASHAAVATAQRTGESEMTKGLQFHLSEGSEGPARTAPLPAASAAPLPDSDTAALLSRVSPIKSDPDDQKDFALRDRSLPPPLTGKTVTESFPPRDQLSPPADQAASGPLEIVRYAPEGDVPIAPHLSVTFSQPMVAVTSQEQAATQVPVELSPKVPGKWRWVGTKTLLFEPDGRFPMATSYKASIAAGTRSALGQPLASATNWAFSTPPVQIKDSYPGDKAPQRRDPLLFVSFDQRINPDAILGKLRVSSGKSQWKVKLAAEDDVKADTEVQRLIKSAGEGRWLAFRAVPQPGADAKLPLPADSEISVIIDTGTPSAEGPRLTESAQSFTFHTYGLLRVTSHDCGYQGCHPYDPWSIQFSNPLDTKAFESSQIKVVPELPGMKTWIYGQTLQIQGAARGRTTYRVTVDPSIKDQFGQTLEKAETVSFDVQSAEPALLAPKEGFVIADPFAQPRFSLYSINYNSLKISLYSAGPEDWDQFMAFMKYWQRNDQTRAANQAPPGRLLESKAVAVQSQPDEIIETRIDLSPGLKEGHGHVIVIAEPSTRVQSTTRRYRRDAVCAWVEVTGIGLDAFADNSDMVAWTTSLKDGRPLEGVQIQLMSGSKGQSVTGPDGIARFSLEAGQHNPTILIARKGNDLAILPQSTAWWYEAGGWRKTHLKDELRWYVFDDRGMYRPGEQVHVKGWIRRVGAGKTGDVGALEGAVSTVSYSLKDSRNNEVAKGAAQVDALGGFDTAFKLPDAMNLGHATLHFDSGTGTQFEGASFDHVTQVQEFRRPEFDVSATASDGPHFVGGSANVTVNAKYYAGGAMPDADVNWRVVSTPGNFTPPNRSEFTFGEWTPWWGWWGRHTTNDESHVETFTGHTDASGKHILRIDLDSAKPPRAYNVTAEATVFDVNRQGWNGKASLLIHPADLYVGLRSPRTFVQKGEPLVVQSIATDLDGKAIAGRTVSIKAVRLDWTYEKGEWAQKEVEPQQCTVTSSSDAVECKFPAKEGGQYRVTATILDEQQRPNQSSLTLWVAGGKLPPKRDVEQEEASLIPDRKEYQPGDTAEILVQSPWASADGVLTLRRSGIVSSKTFKMDGPTTTLHIPIEEGYTPNITVQVDLVGAAGRKAEGDATGKSPVLPKRPAFASGSLDLAIPPRARTLSVKAVPRDTKVEPGGETIVDVQVQDASGKPVAGSEVAVVVVDEAILALTSYKLEDPISTFYSQRPSGVSDYRSRSNIALANPEDLLRPGSGVGMGGGVLAKAMPAPGAPMQAQALERLSQYAALQKAGPGDGSTQPQIRVRENFDPLAEFAAAVPTDSDGRATVKVTVPDSLTRYRVMAVSVAGAKHFGSGESAITARLPLMVRPSPPRFLNFGDCFELPIVVQNQTDSPMEIGVAVRAVNATLTGGTPGTTGAAGAAAASSDSAGRTVTVPANDRVEVRFPAAAVQAGTARFQVVATSGKWSDAAEFELPVWTPATTEAFATYGEIDQGAIAQPVLAPPDAVKQFGGLEITTSSTELQSLTDAVIYLAHYPFECSEQISSRVLAISALRDVLSAFKSKGLPKPEELTATIDSDIKRLKSMQNDDGSFGFWKRGDEAWPYLGIHVAHALQQAKLKRFDVPSDMLRRSQSYLREIDRHIPDYYGSAGRRALVAYALYVRNLMGDRDPAQARRLIAEEGLDGLSIESMGWLLPVLSGGAASRDQVAAIRKYLNNRVEEQSGTAHFTSSYGDGDHLLLHSDRRTDGVVLDALIVDQPDSDLIPKLVRGLLAHRVAGRWNNTQENAFILLALDRYFNTYEKTTPNFTARAWLGDDYAGGHEFKGRSTERSYLSVPMMYLMQASAPQKLVLSKDGAGRLYYRIAMQYSPVNLNLKPADYGFAVDRTYEAVDNPSDVRRDSEGTWHIKAGATVRVRLTMVAQARRYHVALVDPIPAGLEALNPALAVTGSIPQDPKAQDPKSQGVTKRWWWWTQPWFEHQNMRDERVEAFTSLLWEGVYNYSYVARATTPGVFVVPPTKAEEMYHPETFGRGATDHVIVE